MWTDLRFALNVLRRRPLVATAVILTLGLGIGANAAIFRAFNTVFLRPLPFRDADRLVRIVLASADRNAQLSPRTDVFLALREHNRVFSSVAAQRYNDLTLTGKGDPQQVTGIQVSEGWTTTLGLTPVIGRTFSSGEEREGTGAGVILISHRMWHTYFGGEKTVLAEQLRLNGRPYRVVGVLPPGVRFPYEADVWIPTRFDLQSEATWGLNIVGRLRPDISPELAAANLKNLSTQLEAVRAQHGMELFARSIRDTLIEDQGSIVVAVTFASAFLLLLVAVNVANLLTAQSLSRQREYAVRSALGATFGRHLRQAMAEGLVLATAGGVVALLVANGMSSLLSPIVPEDFTYVSDGLPIDARTIIYFVSVVLLVGVAFGAVPASRMSRRQPQLQISATSRTTDDRSSRWRATLSSMAQIALALALLAGAHAAIVDVQRRVTRDPGIDIRDVHMARIGLPSERYPDAESRDRFFDRLQESLTGMPGFERTGAINLFPGADMGALIARVEGEGVPYRPESPLLAHNRIVHGDAMQAMRVRLLRGRLIDEDEYGRGDAVAVVSRDLAQSLWRGEDPIGKTIRNRRLDDSPWFTVVGVVGEIDEHYADTTRSLWTPVKANTANAYSGQATIVVRSSLDPAAVTQTIRRAVADVDSQLAVYDTATIEQIYGSVMRGRRSARTLIAAFSALGLIVAAIGVYASMAFAVSRRTREIAVRIALGATPRLLTTLFLRESLAVIGGGLAIGIGAMLWTRRIAGGWLTEVTPGGAAMMSAGAIIVTVALIASLIPLRRVLRTSPRDALQNE